jgi:hypothetical protein
MRQETNQDKSKTGDKAETKFLKLKSIKIKVTAKTKQKKGFLHS